ncbi:hypothetical protein Kpol_1038p12 [Vanderwaltozyma polyspora DSM 70294]|uniref:J domain-containing protein n=1 Tax=Vanderwaltozyma polyspora (strain ATCC 22028 / DSM 70294 / BCRC 21397 / CBS 2163 / NBRC 10782 / NRRL Y-8283 / UCD 57-17) TaxID=436907 RepID=A7TR03_VANPO|nr:uncharacterized protein Kpol_1038p12 [Vanderwaltozyma polyspora DSM 70294]EDO15306.1 hypothetical protein Kpol_1038p12 [Vanderwaltozyma polyspora DSM 70294]
MVVPIIIGLGVTAAALVASSGVRAWAVYKRLTPLAIAQLNGIKIKSDSKMRGDFRFISSQLDSNLKFELNQYQGGFYRPMSEAEALLILDISPNEIRNLDKKMLAKKHRKAIILNHPDKGGSPYLAMKINEAKDLISSSYLIRQ